jgi:hypothetical protein
VSPQQVVVVAAVVEILVQQVVLQVVVEIVVVDHPQQVLLAKETQVPQAVVHQHLVAAVAVVQVVQVLLVQLAVQYQTLLVVLA